LLGVQTDWRTVLVLVAIAQSASACGAASPPAQPPVEVVKELWEAETKRQALATSRSAQLDLSVLAGQWVARDEAGWHLRYRFDPPNYTAIGYPDWVESGRIEKLATSDQRLRLLFTGRVFDGKPDESIQQWVDLEADLGAFVLNGDRFVREPTTLTIAGAP